MEAMALLERLFLQPGETFTDFVQFPDGGMKLYFQDLPGAGVI
jgi:hypothetical protein